MSGCAGLGDGLGDVLGDVLGDAPDAFRCCDGREEHEQVSYQDSCLEVEVFLVDVTS